MTWHADCGACGPRRRGWHEGCSNCDATPGRCLVSAQADGRGSKRHGRAEATADQRDAAKNHTDSLRLLERDAGWTPGAPAAGDRALADRRHPVRDFHARAHRCRHLPVSAWPARGCARCSARSCAAGISSTAGARRTATCSRAIWLQSASRVRSPSSACRAAATSRHRVELEAVLLPLVHAGQKIGRIIGAMSADLGPALARQRAPAQPPPTAPRAHLAGWAAARGGRARRAAGAVPAAARPDAHRQDRASPVSRLRRRAGGQQVGKA